MNLWITGDSTTSNQAKDESLVSWGEVFDHWFDPEKITVKDAAISGCSIRDYVNQGHWAKLMSEVQKGDVILTCHGHLERAPLTKEVRGSRGSLVGDDDRFVVVYDPDYKREEMIYTFGWYVRKFISASQANGGDLIMLSPPPRAIWENGRIRRGQSLTYMNLTEKIAFEKGAKFLDIGKSVADAFNQLGMEAVAEFFGHDNLHTNNQGAEFIADAIFHALSVSFPDIFPPLAAKSSGR